MASRDNPQHAGMPSACLLKMQRKRTRIEYVGDPGMRRARRAVAVSPAASHESRTATIDGTEKVFAAPL
jgi:hypothetical protein